jgi:CRP-like cAMP-binding protein
LAPGEYLFRIGEPGDGCYLIDSGTVELVAPVPGVRDKFVGPGEVVDAAGLLSERLRAMDAHARSAVRARWLPGSAATELCGRRPDMLMVVLAELPREGAGRRHTSADAKSAAELIAHGSAAQSALAGWADRSLDDLVCDLAVSAAERAEHLASTTLAEAGSGDLVAETRANQRASRRLYDALLRLGADLAQAAGAVRPGNSMTLGFVPQHYGVATTVAATLLAIGGRRGLILSSHQAARQSCRHLARLIDEVLIRHQAPHGLVQWVQWGTGCAAALEQMSDGGRAIVLDDGSIE